MTRASGARLHRAWVGVVATGVAVVGAGVGTADAGGRRAGILEEARQRARSEVRAARFDAAERALADGEAALGDGPTTAAELAALELSRVEIAYYRGFVVAPPAEATIDALRAALRSAEAAGDAALTAEARDRLALGLFARDFRAGDHAEARSLLERALATRRELGDGRGVAETLFHLGLTWEHPKDPTPADAARAVERYQEALAVATAGGFGYEASYAERHLAGQADDAGDVAAARAGFERSLALRREAGATLVLAPALTALADVLVKQGERERARELYEEALRVAREIDAPRFATEPEEALRRLAAP